MPLMSILTRPVITATLIAVLLLGAAILSTTSPARANPIAGATYTGTHSRGGTVEFAVSDDGSAVLFFSVSYIPDDECTLEGFSTIYSPPLSITGKMFTDLVDPSAVFDLVATGSFPTSGSAEGTFRITDLLGLICNTGTISWSATTSPPTPTPTATPTPTPTATPTPSVPGDVDKDGDADVFDALAILNALVDIEPLEFPDNGDVNGDLTTNIFDALAVLGIVVSAP